MSTNNHQTENEKKSTWKIQKLPEKKFVLRNSLLTDLFENPHIKTVHHIFVAILVGLFVNTIAHDYLKRGEIKLGLRLIYSGMGKFHLGVLSWCGFFGLTCLCYVLFNIWAKVRINLAPKSQNIKIWNFAWLLALIGYYVFSFRLASIIVTIFKFPPGTSAFLVLEQARMQMKIHAFVRTNADKVLKYKAHSDKELQMPSFRKFLYFFFAPTLIYRDEYPRTKEIRWNFVAYRLLEIAGAIFYYSFVIERFIIPVYHDFGLRRFTWSEILLSIFENSVTGILLLLCAFYLVLHSVQNLFGELLRFGDREFYKDWWTSTSYSNYFRTWNTVVHDWLYTYIYKDVYEIFLPGNKSAAKFIVFAVSAIVHEWVLTNMFGFFFPALFVQFIFAGTFLTMLKAPDATIVNIIFWYGLAFGAGSLASMYSLEYYARQNVPVENSTMRDFLIPRLLTCDCID